MRTYGSILWDGAYRITCEPQVALRMKRVFPQIKKGTQGVIILSDTVDNARDLEWFLDRYPMEGDTSRLHQKAAEHREHEEVVAALLAHRGVSSPINLALPLRDYQQTATALAYTRKGLLLADDVGLGKTAVGIGLLAHPSARPALVVTLTHLPGQWKSEIMKFAPELTVRVIKGGKPYDLTQRKGRGQQYLLPNAFPDVVIINYHKLSTWAETLAPIMRSVIFDECQEVRRVESNKYRAAKFIADKMDFRLGLSATPFYNYGGEMFNVMECLAPGSLGTWSEFNEAWCTYSYEKGKERIQNPRAFGSYLRESGLMLRRTRKEVGRELPRCTRIPQKVDADVHALDKVSTSCAELAKAILAQGESRRGEKMQMSEEFSNALRQATGIAKAPYVAEFVRLLVESGEKVVLYGWHREVYSIWQDRLKDLSPVLYTGSESPNQKESSKHAFCKGDAKVMMISLRAGAGLDGLQLASSVVVFGELDWSPGVHEQCVGRVDRDGQTTPVMAYFMISDHGADPVMAQVLGMKKRQIEGVRDDSGELIEALQNDGGHIKRLAEAYLQSHGREDFTEE